MMENNSVKPQPQPNVATIATNNNIATNNTNYKESNTPLTPFNKRITSYHRKPLPPSCTPFSSPHGQTLFYSSSQHYYLQSFFPLMEQYLTQSEPAYCGISTLVMILNAFAIDPRVVWKGIWRFYTEEMLNCCMDLEIVKKEGITLPAFVCLAYCQGLNCDLYYANNNNNNNNDNENNNENTGTLQHFRKVVKQVCFQTNTSSLSLSQNDDPQLQSPQNSNSTQNHKDDLKTKSTPISSYPNHSSATTTTNNNHKQYQFLVVSYNRSKLQQSGQGHFSPIAAYDPITDQVLILDVARFKYGPHWVSLPLLYDAMTSHDTVTKKPRGYVLLSFQDDDNDENDDKEENDGKGCHDGCTLHSRRGRRQGILPQSILFRSEMSHYPVRQRYKTFLSSMMMHHHPLSFQDVYKFWILDNHNNNNNNNDENTEWNEKEETIHPTIIRNKNNNNLRYMNNDKCNNIWTLLTTQLIPIDLDEKELVDEILSLLKLLTESFISEIQIVCSQQHTNTIQNHNNNTNNNNTQLLSTMFLDTHHHNSNNQNEGNCSIASVPCRKSGNRMIPIRSIDAIYIVYLSSLSTVEERRQILHQSLQQDLDDSSTNFTFSERAIEQLLSEAELVRLAIDHSEDIIICN